MASHPQIVFSNGERLGLRWTRRQTSQDSQVETLQHQLQEEAARWVHVALVARHVCSKRRWNQKGSEIAVLSGFKRMVDIDLYQNTMEDYGRKRQMTT